MRPHEALDQADVYAPSPREYPARVPEPEYPSTMLVRSVKSQGAFRWKKHDVFLSEVLWGERIGLLPRDERWFTIYFAQLPLAEFDSPQLRIVPLPKNRASTWMGQGKRKNPLHPIPSKPWPSRKCQECARSKLSGICPAVHARHSHSIVAGGLLVMS